MNAVLLDKVKRFAGRKLDALYGSLFTDLDSIMADMFSRPFELHFELTNLCNAKCLFCPYQFQQRRHEFMPDSVFNKALTDFAAIGGGSVGLTPIVGDALIDPHFLERVHTLRSCPEVDRIFLTTNAILIDRFGAEEIIDAGISSITISTAGFEEESYRRIYQSASYQRMRDNVVALFEANEKRGRPVNLAIGLRSDRPLDQVLRDPDFQPILRFEPQIDFTWSFTSANGLITRDILPAGMKFRTAPPKKELCVNAVNGPIVLPDGTVLACSCLGAMDALEDLRIGDITQESLLEVFTGQLMRDLRRQFAPGGVLNPTCAGCDAYRDLELYRTREGRERAILNRRRGSGEVVHRAGKAKGVFAGG